ncbi:MAG TPA: cysteine desulfurase family protein [Longimicrobiales bacterium]|nr:cysteine desulfurase family protein [Longimicrobiales bacterium]
MEPIYLDYAATTPVRDEVRAVMEPYLWKAFGNPSSTHRWGREAQAGLEEARSTVAGCLGVSRREILFVRGGTESDNLAILGRAEAHQADGACPHVVTSTIEHKAVLEAARAVEGMGGRCTVLPVDRGGRVLREPLEAALADDACLLSLMWVNNEVGTIQALPEIVALARERGVPVHTDAVQAVGKVPVDLEEVPVDYLSLSGHKFYGPKSTGVLFVRDGSPLSARLHGGGQEAGLRPGTQDVAGAVGLARALVLALEEQEAFRESRQPLRDRLQARLQEGISGLVVHGIEGDRAPHILNVGVPDVPAELLHISLDLEGLAVSGGSACQSGSGTGSHVVRALLGDESLPATLRFSLGRTTTEAEVDRAAEITLQVVHRLRPAVPA